MVDELTALLTVRHKEKYMKMEKSKENGEGGGKGGGQGVSRSRGGKIGNNSSIVGPFTYLSRAS